MAQEQQIARVIDDVMRQDKGRLLAGLVARFRDFSAAEDALQEALVAALSHWQKSEIPHSPSAWLMKVAVNKGVDSFRANTREAQKAVELEKWLETDGELCDFEEISDERLRLIFTCCHPALEEKSRVALTLRTVCNLTTQEVAAAFLDNESTMGQRIFRAKAKIKSKGIGFSVPGPDIWPQRLGTVLSTLYLIFTTGYLSEDDEARGLCAEALFLSRLLVDLRPGDSEIEGVLSLMLLTQGRLSARVAADGSSIPIEQQPREKWDAEFVLEGQQLLATAIARRQPGPFQIKAAISDCHMLYPKPDWLQMSLLYESLWYFEPTPVVALNWGVVMAELGHTELAWQKIVSLETELSEFQPWHAARASLLAALGRKHEAVEAYQEAINQTSNSASRKFLEKKLAQQGVELTLGHVNITSP